MTAMHSKYATSRRVTNGLWPETMNGCSRCGAREPTRVAYFCRAVVRWTDGPTYCDEPASILLLRTGEARCTRHGLDPDNLELGWYDSRERNLR